MAAMPPFRRIGLADKDRPSRPHPGGQQIIPITHDIEIAFTYSQNWPLGAALAVLLMLVVGVLVILALRRFDLDTFLGRR